MESIPVSIQTNPNVLVLTCAGCGAVIFDSSLKYCSTRCRIACESFRVSETGPKVRKELEVLMEQYRRGGVGEDYYS